MPRLEAQYTSAFARDVKRLRKRRIDDAPLAEVIELIMENTPEAHSELKRRHNMHSLSGRWAGSSECHVCNAGDWILIWTTFDNIALIQRTGSHDELSVDTDDTSTSPDMSFGSGASRRLPT